MVTEPMHTWFTNDLCCLSDFNPAQKHSCQLDWLPSSNLWRVHISKWLHFSSRLWFSSLLWIQTSFTLLSWDCPVKTFLTLVPYWYTPASFWLHVLYPQIHGLTSWPGIWINLKLTAISCLTLLKIIGIWHHVWPKIQPCLPALGTEQRALNMLVKYSTPSYNPSSQDTN